MRHIFSALLIAGSVFLATSVFAQPTLGEQPRGLAAAQGVEALKVGSPELKVVWQRGGDAPAMLTQLSVETRGDSAEARAWGFVEAWSGALGLRPEQLVHVETHRMKGRQNVRYRQALDGLPVEGRGVTITLDEQQRVIAVSSDAVSLEELQVGSLDEASAIRAAAASAPGATALGVSLKCGGFFRPVKTMIVFSIALTPVNHCMCGQP